MALQLRRHVGQLAAHALHRRSTARWSPRDRATSSVPPLVCAVAIVAAPGRAGSPPQRTSAPAGRGHCPLRLGRSRAARHPPARPTGWAHRADASCAAAARRAVSGV